MKYIAIDIGSSFIKSAVLDAEKLQIYEISKEKTPEKLHNDFSGFYEIDPLWIANRVTLIIERHLMQCKEVKGILLATQMHGFVLCDPHGMAVTPYISWQDTRCMESFKSGPLNYMERLLELVDADDIKRTGIKLKPGLAACNLFHWMEHNKTDINKKQNLSFCTLGSYISLRLTGHNACHITNAAATGFVDIIELKWNGNIIKAVGCEALTFPEILNEGELCGYYNSAFGNVPLYPDIGDHQATVLGTLAENERSAIITVGTAGIVSKITKDIVYGDYEIRPYFDNTVLWTVTRLPGGRNLDVLIQLVESIGKAIYGVSTDKNKIWEEILKSIENEKTENVEVSLGFFKEQLGVKYGRIDDINASNLTLDSLFKGAFQNMAQVYNWAVEKLSGSSNHIENLVLSGGVFQGNEFLKRALETETHKKALLSPVREEALVGLLRIALKMEGQFNTLAETAQLLKNRDQVSLVYSV